MSDKIAEFWEALPNRVPEGTEDKVAATDSARECSDREEKGSSSSLKG